MTIDQEKAEELAQRILGTLGPAEALFLSMRLVVLVGQQIPDDPEILEAAKDSLAAIKRVGTLAGVLHPS